MGGSEVAKRRLRDERRATSSWQCPFKVSRRGAKLLSHAAVFSTQCDFFYLQKYKKSVAITCFFFFLCQHRLCRCWNLSPRCCVVFFFFFKLLFCVFFFSSRNLLPFLFEKFLMSVLLPTRPGRSVVGGAIASRPTFFFCFFFHKVSPNHIPRTKKKK